MATDKLRPRIWWILKAYFNPLFGLRSIVVPLFLGLWGFWKLRDQPHVRLWMTIVIALCTVLVTYSARFSSYALIPLSLTSGLLLDLWLQRGVRRAVVLRIVLLLLLNVPASFALFKYNFDYLRPHDVAQEELIREAGQIIPKDKTVCVRELFDAYRVAWYADRSSTILELECGNSEFLYLRGEDTPPDGWVQIVQKESHRLYHRLTP